MISEEKVSAYLVEFFSFKYVNSVVTVNPSDLKERLFRPVFFNFVFYELEKWTILQSDPHYSIEDSDYKNIKIAFASSLPPKLWQAGKTSLSKSGELAGLETSIAWVPDSMINRIKDHFDGKYGPLDVYPT